MSRSSEERISTAVMGAKDVYLPPKVQAMIVSESGKPFSNVANVLILLRTNATLRGKFRYNEFLRDVEQTGSLGDNGAADIVYPRRLCDSDAVLVQERLQHGDLVKIGLGTVHDAIDLVARELSYHPVRDWLDALAWDGTPRISGWLQNYLGGQSKAEYMASVGAMFLIGMVARIYEPGCQADYTLILEGAQGAQKSSACRILGGEYFSDALPPDVAQKDAGAHLRGKWLIEIGEMHAFTKSETASLKAFLTRRTEIYRPAYGRREVREPRQSMFVGTTNKQRYLRDETGARRFWPVTVKNIDLTALAADRNQLFAEAVARYKRKENWWPSSSFESEFMKPEQADRREDEPWEEPIANYLFGVEMPTIGQIAKEALHIETARISTIDARRIAAVLESLGWERAPRTSGARRWSRIKRN